MYLLQLVKEKNNFSPVFARGALCTSFILSAVYNDCVSSSERASIASNWCVRIYAPINVNPVAGGSAGKGRGFDA